MRVIIAGSRTVTDPGVIAAAVEASGFQITTVLSGAARGVDHLGEAWADQRGIPVQSFPADWSKYGRSAGMIRNTTMANYAEALIAIWAGQSPGTRHMIQIARKLGLRVYVHQIGEPRQLSFLHDTPHQ